jgi:hypothetical protein
MSQEYIDIAPDVMLSTASGVVYDFTSKTYSKTAPDLEKKGGKRIIKWGADNMLPYENRQILAENDIKQSLVNTEVFLSAGKCLNLYTERKEGGKKVIELVDDPELADWMEDIQAHETFSEILTDLSEMGNGWVEFVLQRDGKKVASIQSMDAVDCRLSEDPDLMYVADWKYNRLTAEKIADVQLLNIRKPDLANYFKSALHIKQIQSGQPFYSLAGWYGTKGWSKIANRIPEFHLNGLESGYMLRYHVKMPKSYFDQFGSTDQKEKKKKELQTQLDSVLSGSANAHKTFYSFIEDKIPNAQGFSIEKIETDLKDESYLKLHDHASKLHARGHNIHPVLAGIETSGSLSSGSEILNLLNFHIAYKTPRPRNICLRPINLAKNFNFPNKRHIKIGVEDVVLTTTDKNPNGQQNSM